MYVRFSSSGTGSNRSEVNCNSRIHPKFDRFRFDFKHQSQSESGCTSDVIIRTDLRSLATWKEFYFVFTCNLFTTLYCVKLHSRVTGRSFKNGSFEEFVLTTCAGNWLRTITSDRTVYSNSSRSFLNSSVRYHWTKMVLKQQIYYLFLPILFHVNILEKLRNLHNFDSNPEQGLTECCCSLRLSPPSFQNIPKLQLHNIVYTTNI